MAHEFQSDLDAIARIDAVPTILDVVCRVTGMRFAAVARVTEDRWVACSVRDEIAFGLTPGDELRVKTTICDEIRTNRQAVVIDNVSENPAFRSHHTPAMYGFKSYISVPIITKDGTFFGTLCAIDPLPAKLENVQTVGMFKLFAELIAFHLRSDQQLAEAEAMLLTERQGAELREQFIAVLGHDLRNPLAAIDAGARLLQKTPLNEKAAYILPQMQASVARMSGLITNVLDFARGKLGGGLPIEPRDTHELPLMLALVVSEIQATHPDRMLQSSFEPLGVVRCDAGRIGQMLSNLLGNAINHGAQSAPIRVTARRDDAALEIAVINQGDPIPDAIAEQLFQPFFRATAKDNQQGLGLGLYIASEIARAHRGTLTAHSTDDETHFTFRMPLL